MFCTNCGREMADDALFCPNCGRDKNGFPGMADTRLVANDTGPNLTIPYVFSILSIVFSGTIGWILGVVALVMYKNAVIGYENPPKTPKVLAIIGISLGAIGILTFAILMIVGIAQNGLGWQY